MMRDVLGEVCKLIASESGNNVRITKCLSQDRGRFSDCLGAFTMPKCVVDFFKTIQVSIK